MLPLVELFLVSLALLPATGVRARPNNPDPRQEGRHTIPWGAGGATDTDMRGFKPWKRRWESPR